MHRPKQISLFDIYEGISTSIEEKKPELISLIDDNINFNSFISPDFYYAFYSRFGRKHKYHLISFIKALTLSKLLGFSDSQLITVLKCSKELRDFCELDKVPDASYFTRFKQNFGDFIVDMFDRLVDITEPICRKISEKKAAYLIYDTTGIKLNVTENNPKFFNSKLKQAKKFCTDDQNPYKLVYGLLPDVAASNNDAKQQYINGHFCYALKAGIITNGLGIIRDISVFDENFKTKHKDIVTQKSDDPDADKEIADSKSLKPVLSDFYSKHEDFKAQFGTFIGDSAFDSYDNYTMLKNDFDFNRICIPMNQRNTKETFDNFDEYGTPLCPKDKQPFIYLGKSGGKNRSLRLKWVCQKSVSIGTKRICTCETPCTDSTYGKCVYTYPNKQIRLYPGITRNTEHWDNLYKHRVLIERTINILKDSLGVNVLKTHNTKTVKADLYISGVVHLIGVLLADALNKPEEIKSIRRLISKVA